MPATNEPLHKSKKIMHVVNTFRMWNGPPKFCINLEVDWLIILDEVRGKSPGYNYTKSQKVSSVYQRPFWHSREKTCRGGTMCPPSLNRVKIGLIQCSFKLLDLFGSKKCQAATGKHQSSKPTHKCPVDALHGNLSM